MATQLTPTKKRLFRDRGCVSKRWFLTEREAYWVARHVGTFILEDKMYHLEIYQCPYDTTVTHWHLTKRPGVQ